MPTSDSSVVVLIHPHPDTRSWDRTRDLLLNRELACHSPKRVLNPLVFDSGERSHFPAIPFRVQPLPSRRATPRPFRFANSSAGKIPPLHSGFSREIIWEIWDSSAIRHRTVEIRTLIAVFGERCSAIELRPYWFRSLPSGWVSQRLPAGLGLPKSRPGGDTVEKTPGYHGLPRPLSQRSAFAVPRRHS